MHTRVCSVALASSLCLFSFSTFAEDMYRGAWYLLPGVSMMWADHELEAKNRGGGFFLKAGKQLSPDWDIQGGLSYHRVSEDTNIAGVGGHYKQLSLGVDALYFLSRQPFRPFVLAGGGIARNNLDYSNLPGLQDRMRTSWMTNVGLGAQWLVSDAFGLQLDIRHQWSRSDANAPGTSVDTSGTINNTLLNFGAMFRFGTPNPLASNTPEPAPMAATPARTDPPPTVAATEPTVAPVVVAPAPVTPGKPALNCTPQFETITLSAEKLFDFDATHMQAGAKPLLDHIIDQLNAHPEFELVMVTGHTDRIGKAAYNQKLSEARAMQVKAYLVAAGIAPQRLQSVGKGESEPKVECPGLRGEALIACLQPNRRVVIEDQAQHGLAKRSGCP